MTYYSGRRNQAQSPPWLQAWRIRALPPPCLYAPISHLHSQNSHSSELHLVCWRGGPPPHCPSACLSLPSLPCSPLPLAGSASVSVSTAPVPLSSDACIALFLLVSFCPTGRFLFLSLPPGCLPLSLLFFLYNGASYSSVSLPHSISLHFSSSSRSQPL